MIRTLTIWLARRRLARRRLARMVEAERNSYRCESFRRHRAAALKGLWRAV